MAVDMRRMPGAREWHAFRTVREAGLAVGTATLNTIIVGLLALVLVGGTVVLAISGRPIPELIGALDLTIGGFYFGSVARSISGPTTPPAPPAKE